MVNEATTRNGPEPLSAADETPPHLYAEVGTTGLRRFGGEVQEEFDPNLRGLRGVRVYDEMRRNDSDVGAILFAILHIGLHSEWTAEPASREQADLDAADFLRECLFDDMSHSWRNYFTDAMTSNAFGWAWHEMVFKQRLGPAADPPSRFDDGRIGIRKIALRGQETLLRWVFDEHGGIQAMIQRGAPDFKETLIPIGKSVLHRTSSEKGNPEGISLLRNAYRSYFIKTNMEEIEVIGAERDMTGVLKITVPSNASTEDFNKARDMGERYHVDDQTYFVLQKFGPEAHQGWEIDVVKTPGQKVVDTDKTIMRCSTHIMRSVLAQFLTLGSGRTGSFALSDSQKSLWTLAVNGRLDTFEDEVNQFVVPKLFALNSFPGISGLPKIRHSDPSEIDLDKLTPFLRVLGEFGFLVSPTQEAIEHLYKRAGLPAPDPDAAENFNDDEPEPGEPRNLPKNPARQHQT